MSIKTKKLFALSLRIGLAGAVAMVAYHLLSGETTAAILYKSLAAGFAGGFIGGFVYGLLTLKPWVSA
jgi:hypothetical protein